MTTPDADYPQFETQHRNLLDQYTALVRFKQSVYGRLALHAMASSMRDRTDVQLPSASGVISQACELAAAAAISDTQTHQAIRKYLKSVVSSVSRLGKAKGRRRGRSTAEKVIDEAIDHRRTQIEAALQRIPPSIEKARAALAYELLSEDGEESGPPDALCAFGADESRARFNESVKRRREELLSGHAMRTSARGWEPYWYTSYLRYYETFEPKDARELILSEAQDIEDDVRQSASSVISGNADASHALPRFVDLVFAYGRCRIVRHVLMPLARRALPALLRLQRTNGAWADWRSTRDSGTPPLFDDASTTACAIAVLARYGSAEENERAFKLSQSWLLGAQREDGSWRSGASGGADPSISTTCLVLEALKLTGIPADHPSVARGEVFLMAHQQSTGLWSEKSGMWETHVTAQVVEYFQSRAERPGTLNSYLKSARSLLLKSEQLTLSEDHTDGPLATAAAYHGLEHFLYGCLLHMDSDEPIYVDTRGATIGFNSALGAFERALLKRGDLKASARLPYRQQLQHLGAKRDMFIHRAEVISMPDAFGFVATCRAFVQRYDLKVLGFRLYD